MAETNTDLLHPLKLSDPSLKDQKSSTSFLSNSICKAIFFVVIVALLPLFPSEAPQFMNKSISTRSWELIHLLIVGIAISYGLFSRRNTEPEVEKEAPWKAESPQSYLSQILHGGSTVFDEEEVEESPPGVINENKIQISSSQYYRNEPLVVVADRRADDGREATRPLFLPIRSLKWHAEESRKVEEAHGHSVSGNGIISGRMEMKIPTSSSFRTPSAFNEDSAPSKTPSLRASSMPRSAGSPSPSRSSPSPETSEIRGKSSEDRTKKKSFYPPPAPPPPPPFTGHGYHYSLDKKLGTQSFKDELKDSRMRGKEASKTGGEIGGGMNPLMSATKLSNSSEISSVGRSVRTIRSKDFNGATTESAAKTVPEPLPMNGFMDKLVVSDDSESDEDDDVVVNSSINDVSSSAPTREDENEVDKKADEFIAKFREQIRLQRIESIKRSTRQRRASKPK